MTTPNMLKAALWYARQGFAVVPGHTVIQTKNGPRCTCSRGVDCGSIGKHPRTPNGVTDASNDPAQIRSWWSKWPNANVGFNAGLSGVLVLDKDSYKKDYQGDGLLTLEEEQTVTVLSGSGGEHLYYRMPAGKTWGNATGNLPAGIDIRGHNGYVVAAPSLHASGNRYQFEDGYRWGDVELLNPPVWLARILDETPQNRPKEVGPSDIEAVTKSVAVVDHVLEALDLATAPVAEYGKEGGRKFIFSHCPYMPEENPHADDGAAFIIILRDGTIGAGCHHARCQETIRNSQQSGWNFLQSQVTLPPEMDMRTEIYALMEWCLSHSFAPYIPDAYKAHIWERHQDGPDKGAYIVNDKGARILARIEYRTDATDTKIAVGILNVCALKRTQTPLISLRQLALDCGVGSAQTVANALERLTFLFDYSGESRQITLVEGVSRRLDIVLSSVNTEYMSNLRDTHLERVGTDPFLTGISRTMKDYGKLLAKEFGTEPEMVDHPLHGQVLRPAWKIELDDAARMGLGEAGLRGVAVLERDGESAATDIAAATGKSVHSIRRVLTRLVDYEIVREEQDPITRVKQYELVENWQNRIEQLTTTFKTFLLSAERHERTGREIQKFCDRRIDNAVGTDRPADLQRRREWAVALRRDALGRIHQDWTESQIESWINQPVPLTRPWEDSQGGLATETKAREYEFMIERVNSLLSRERFLYADEMAELRQYAGRLGYQIEQLTDVVESQLCAIETRI